MAERKKVRTVIEEDKREDTSVYQDRYIWGWESAQDVANTVWNSIHSELLSGNLIFAYRNTATGSELHQVVVVHNPTNNDYAVGVITNTFTYLLPRVPLEYIKVELVSDLEKYKVNKNVLEAFKQIINNLK